MYILKKEQGDGIFYILNDKEYVVGRKNADLVISDDQSLSRKHAVINTKGNAITLTDCNSKYGTFHNNVQVPGDTDVTLKHNDLIKFGVFQSKYKIEKFPIITAGSGLSQQQKNDLKAKLTTLGGTLVSNWDDSCTFLTTPEIVLTVKVLLAVIDDKPIVNLEYWDHFTESIKTLKPLPKIADFRPPMTETLIDLIEMSFNPKRRELFVGKVFVFSTDKVKKKMVQLITKTSGSCISWERQELSLTEVTKSKNKYIFVNDVDNPGQLPKTLKNIHEYIEKLGERIIPVQEIAMAVVFCSLEKDCNPKFNRIDNVFKVSVPVTQTEDFSLAADSASQNGSAELTIPKREQVISGSLESDLDMFVTPQTPQKILSLRSPVISRQSVIEKSGSKHPLETSENTPSKRIRLEEIPPTSGSIPSTSGLTKSQEGTSKEPPSPQTSNILLESVISKKRPADDSLASTSKKVSLAQKSTVNEISGKKKTNPPKSKERFNPFSALRVKREKLEDDDNIFMDVINKKPQPQKFTQNETLKSPTSIASSYVPSNRSEVIWISSSRIKEESNVGCKIEPELDPEIIEIFDKFKDSVVIETLPASAYRTIVPRNSQTSLNSSTEKKNFKKFRKVQPRRPQTTILVTSIMQNNVLEATFGSDGEENNDDDRAEVIRPVKTSKSKSRFDF